MFGSDEFLTLVVGSWFRKSAGVYKSASHESSALEAHRTAVRPSCFLSGAGRVLGWRPPAGWPCGPARCCGWLLSGVAVMRPCIVREKPTSTYLHILIKGGEGGVKQGTSGPADVS